jgi:hypothetical protein
MIDFFKDTYSSAKEGMVMIRRLILPGLTPPMGKNICYSPSILFVKFRILFIGSKNHFLPLAYNGKPIAGIISKCPNK